MQQENNVENPYSCPKTTCCPFFAMLGPSCTALIERLKERYCFKDNSRCSRYYLDQTLGNKYVPLSLMPHQWEWANRILHDAGQVTLERDPGEMVDSDLKTNQT